MEAGFWHQKWEKGDIGFHRSDVNPFLITYFEQLNLARDSRVFLPLCGKTRDFAWLLACGYRVVGVELSELAINVLFSDLSIEPKISRIGQLTLYRAKDIDILVGDIFEVSADALGPVDAIYDRAALVAIPAHMRHHYTSHLIKITNAAPQLLICYEYNQQRMDGPPFSVSQAEVRHHYAAAYQINLVEHKDVSGGLKGQVPAVETAWVLQRL